MLLCTQMPELNDRIGTTITMSLQTTLPTAIYYFGGYSLLTPTQPLHSALRVLAKAITKWVNFTLLAVVLLNQGPPYLCQPDATPCSQLPNYF